MIGYATCSLNGNDIGNVGAARVSEGLKNNRALTTLSYV